MILVQPAAVPARVTVRPLGGIGSDDAAQSGQLFPELQVQPFVVHPFEPTARIVFGEWCPKLTTHDFTYGFAWFLNE